MTAPMIFAGRIFDRRGAVFDRNLAAIPPNENGVIRQALGGALLERACDWIARDLARVFLDQMQHFADRTADRLGRRPAGQLFRDRVEERHPAIVIHRHDGVADAAEGDAEPLVLFAQFRLARDPLGDVAETPDPPDIAIADPLDF